MLILTFQINNCQTYMKNTTNICLIEMGNKLMIMFDFKNCWRSNISKLTVAQIAYHNIK